MSTETQNRPRGESPNDKAPTVEVAPYVPLYLTPDQMAGLYAQAKQQTEVEILSAWMNYLLLPGDPVRLTTYEKARAALRTLELDESRTREIL